jgi:GNAT superfamily N-acetyltransferase
VGFAIVHVIDHIVHLAEIDVHPIYGRRGIGSALVKTVIEWAKAKNLDSVCLTTFSHIPWNAPLYEKLGFRCLSLDALPAFLAKILTHEAEEGLKNRIAMGINI